MVCPDCQIVFEAEDGLDLEQKLKTTPVTPEVILMDLNMPRRDGETTMQWLKENYPSVKVLVVSMVEKEESIFKMLKLGVKGYLCKDVEPHELKNALLAVHNKGYYYTDYVTGKLVHSLQNSQPENADPKSKDQISEKELKFLRLACTEMTYNEIADKMFLSPKTIDGYRNSLFEKLNVKSRVGLVIYAIKNQIVTLD